MVFRLMFNFKGERVFVSEKKQFVGGSKIFQVVDDDFDTRRLADSRQEQIE